MAITHDEIVTTVLRRLQSFDLGPLAIRDMDEELRQVLIELSEAGEFLIETTTISTVAGTANYDVPSLFRKGRHLAVSGGNDLVEGSWEDYQRYIEGQSSPSRGEPAYWTVFNDDWYLWPVPDAVYTVNVSYVARHSETVSTISFDEVFRTAIVAGTLAALWAGQLAGHAAAATEWPKQSALYQAAVDARRRAIYRGPAAVRYRDI